MEALEAARPAIIRDETLLVMSAPITARFRTPDMPANTNEGV